MMQLCFSLQICCCWLANVIISKKSFEQDELGRKQNFCCLTRKSKRYKDGLCNKTAQGLQQGLIFENIEQFLPIFLHGCLQRFLPGFIFQILQRVLYRIVPYFSRIPPGVPLRIIHGILSRILLRIPPEIPSDILSGVPPDCFLGFLPEFPQVFLPGFFPGSSQEFYLMFPFAQDSFMFSRFFFKDFFPYFFGIHSMISPEILIRIASGIPSRILPWSIPDFF